MRPMDVVSVCVAGLALFCASCATMKEKNSKPAQKTGEVPAVSCRVQVMMLAFDRGEIEPLLKDAQLSAPVLLGLWKEGKARLLGVQSALASSSSEGRIESKKGEYLYRGICYSGGGPNGTPVEKPNYEQRNLGMTLNATVADGTEVNAPVVTIDALAEFIFKPTGGDAVPEEEGIGKYPQTGTVRAKLTSRMPFGEQMLLGGGAESPDKKEMIFIMGRTDAVSEQ